MYVAVDIGNSNVVIGVEDEGEWIHFWRIPTIKSHDALLYYDREIRNLVLEHSLERGEIKGIILSTVVPSLKQPMADILRALFNREISIVGPELYDALNYKVPRPYEIGSDLVANAYSAHAQLKGAAIIVDFGTALTFTTVDPTGYILGVAIAPGIKTAMKALSSNTAQLPEIPLKLPDSVIGLHTAHAMQAGILWGYVGIVKELLSRIRSEVDAEYPAIATGGLSFVMTPLEDLFVKIDPYLTLNGLIYMLREIEINKN